MAQNTNLNIAPYFDDFDSDKGFLKVLFKPGYPVQARELTTLQSVLQNQINSFGQGVYKEGSMVIPGGITLNKNYSAIIVQNNYLNLPVELYREAVHGKIIKGTTSGIRARVDFSISEAQSERGYVTFYISYLGKADDNTSNTFTNGEIIVCEENINYSASTIAAGTPIAQLLNSNASAIGSTANISNGAYFVRGYFVPVLEQTIILDQYGTTPSYKVGLKVEERIITADEDDSLYDNAVGSTNFSAPGADRFKINLSLVKKDLTSPNSADFIELLRTDEGKIENIVQRSDLGFINDVLATRTKEESGDYYVKRFNIDVRESLNDGFNNGVYTDTQTTQDGKTPPVESDVAVQVSPGVAYISGYRTEKQNTTFKDVAKPRTFTGLDSQSISSAFGNYLLVDGAYGAPSLYDTIELRDQVVATGGTAPGSLIGYSRVFFFSYDSGTRDTSTTRYRVGLADIELLTKVTTTGSVTWTAGNYLVGATSGATGFIQSGSGTTGYLYSTSGTFRAGEVLQLNGATFATVASGGITQYNFSDVKSVYVSGFTANAVLDNRFTLQGSGPILSGVSSGSGTVTATLSNFVSQLRVGDIVEFANNGASHRARVTAVTDNYNFNITRLGSTTLANGAITSAITRTRPEIKEAQNRTLLTRLPKTAVKNTNKNNTIAPSGFYRKTYTVTGITGGTFNLSAGTGLSFRDATDADDFTIIITGGTGVGNILTYPNFTAPSGSQTSVTVSGLNGGVTSVKVIATIFKSDRSAKAKTVERMKILKLNRSRSGSSNGLTLSATGYGTRVEDQEISLGCADVFRIKAILESVDSSDPQIPKFQYTNLVGTFSVDSIITGETSGAKAKVVQVDSNYVYFLIINEISFTDGENISSASATAKIVSGSISVKVRDITSHYTFDNGQRDQFYDYSRIIRKSGYAAPARRLFVIFDRFVTTGGEGFYSVDSYPTNVYKEIPDYANLNLRDCLDFRPIVPAVLSGTGSSISDPFLHNTSGYLDFSNRAFTGNLVGLPGQSDSTILSFEYYLPRIDKIFINKNNTILVVKGDPAENPQEPNNIEDAMLLATVSYPAYVFNVSDITIKQTNFKRYTFKDIQILEERIKNLEYYTQLSLLETETSTMTIRDAQGLDRFKNGYVVDNFASLSTSDTLHPDYRCSVDFQVGELRPSHYTTNVPLVVSSASQNIRQTGDLITLPYTDAVLIDQPYASAVENVNPFNVFTYIGDIKLTPESDDWVDTKTLAALQGPTVEGNFLTTVRDYNADQNGLSPIEWGAWQTTWVGVSSSSSSSRESTGKKSSRIRTVTTTTTTTKQTRQGTRFKVTPVIEQQSLGSRVVSVEHIQNMRSRNIEFIVQKLKPKTQFYAFFDSTDIKAYVTPKLLEVTKDPSVDANSNSIPFQVGETVIGLTSGCKFKAISPNDGYTVNPYTNNSLSAVSDYSANLGIINIDTLSMGVQSQGEYYGNPVSGEILVGQISGAKAVVKEKRLISDSTGNLLGTFFIPDPSKDTNPKFKTGSRLFRLTDSPVNSSVQGDINSAAEAEYSATGILQTTQETIISVRNAKVEQLSLTDNRTLVDVTQDVTYSDPLAQTFVIDDGTFEGGVFLTKIDIFFQTKDTEIPVALDIRTVVNGSPTQTILPFSKVVKKAADVFTSADASIPTSFVFESPVYIGYKREHAFVLTSDSNQYKVFISVLGQDAIDAAHAGEKISEQPYIGVLFKSQNASTWTPSQYEDLMFKIYRAAFTLPTTLNPSRLVLDNAVLTDTNGGYLNLSPNPLSLTSGSNQIVVSHGNHGMQSSTNYVEVSGVISEVADTNINMPGSGLTATGGQITVSNAAEFHTSIGGSAVSSVNPGFIRITSVNTPNVVGGVNGNVVNEEIVAYEAINGNVINVLGYGAGTIIGRRWSVSTNSGGATGIAHADGTVVKCYNLAGIPLTKINATHNASTGGLTSLNHPHKYRLTINGFNATKTITAGGEGVFASQNVQWDVLTPSVQTQVQPGTSVVARVLGTSATSCGPFPSGTSPETSFVKDTTYREVTLGEINYFLETKMVASKVNEVNNMAGDRSFTMEMELDTDKDSISPVIDTQRMSIITTANQINNTTPTTNVGDDCAAIYITRLARLENSSTGLKVMFAANLFTPTEIDVMYKLIPVGSTINPDDVNFEFFNTNGDPDSGPMSPQNNPEEFTDFEYTISSSDITFDAFQIKIAMRNYNQPFIPRIRNFRAIALA